MGSGFLAMTSVPDMQRFAQPSWGWCFHAHGFFILAGANLCAQESQCHSERCLSLRKGDNSTDTDDTVMKRKYSLFISSAYWEVGSFKELRGGKQSRLSLFYSVHHPDFQVCITFQRVSPSLDPLTEASITLTRLISVLSSPCGRQTCVLLEAAQCGWDSCSPVTVRCIPSYWCFIPEKLVMGRV